MSLTNSNVEVPKTILSGAVYDRLKFIVQYVMPAAATLYSGLVALWGFPYGVQVVGTISLVTIFLAGTLGFSNVSYNKQVAATEVNRQNLN